MEDVLKYIKEQYEVGNNGRVVNNADTILESTSKEFHRDAYYYKAVALVAQNDLRAGLDTLELAITEFPDDLELRLTKSLTLINGNGFESAKETLLTTKDLFPNNTAVLNNLIYVEEILRNYEGVIQLSTEYIDLSDESFSALLTRASAYEKLSQYEEALNDLQKASQFEDLEDMDLQMINNDFGYIFLKKEDYSKAKEHLEKAVELGENDPYAHNNLGLTEALLGDLQKGFNLVNHALRLDSSFSCAYKNRGKIQLLNNNKVAAMEDLIIARDLGYAIDFDSEVDELILQNQS